jgi:hypothetical protein
MLVGLVIAVSRLTSAFRSGFSHLVPHSDIRVSQILIIKVKVKVTVIFLILVISGPEEECIETGRGWVVEMGIGIPFVQVSRADPTEVGVALEAGHFVATLEFLMTKM